MTTETKHTPGRITYSENYSIGCDESQVFDITVGFESGYDFTATVFVDSQNGARELATILAAAPDLLEACKSAVNTLEQLVKINRIPANSKGLRDARAAIARAETRK